VTTLTLQRMILRAEPNIFRLYWRTDQPGSAPELSPRASLDLDTYFNSFDEALWRGRTRVGPLRLQLDTRGPARILVWRHSRDAGPVLVAEARTGGGDERVELDIPQPVHSRSAGRLGVSIVAGDDAASLRAGRWLSDVGPGTIRLFPVICTYNREEPLKRLVERLVSDREAFATLSGLVIVNNGHPGLLRRLGWRTMPSELRDKLHVVEQDNLGGAGGFTRGMLEARDAGATHVILMDDDVEIEPESVFRTARLYALAREDMVVGGHMLDLFRPNSLYEAGARLDDRRLSIHPLHHHLDVAAHGVLRHFLDPEPAHYNGWWYMGLPLSLLGRHGLPMPCFIRGDDIEFGRRLYEAGVPTVSTPGIGIWHEPFYAKLGSWHLYYEFRNMLALMSRHVADPAAALQRTALRWILADLLTFRYQRAALIIRAVEDSLAGPDIFARPPQEVHQSLDPIRARYPVARSPRSRILHEPAPPVGPRTRIGFATRLSAALLDEWRRPERNRVIRIQPRDHLWFRVRGADVVVVDERWEADMPTYRRSRAEFRSLLRQTVGLWLRMQRSLPAAVALWKDAHAEFTSESFWRRYLGMTPAPAPRESVVTHAPARPALALVTPTVRA